MGKLKPHVVAVPYPAQGHVIPLLEFAQRLANNGVKVSFLNSEFNHERVVQASPEAAGRVHELISLVSIPDGLEAGENRNDIGKLTEASQKTMPGELEHVLKELMEKESGEEICVIADYYVGWAMEVAEKLGLKKASFMATSAALMAYTSRAKKLADDGIVDPINGTPYKKQMVQLAPDIPGMCSMNLSWVSRFDLQAQRYIYNMIIANTKSSALAERLICNTFHDIEKGALALHPNCLPIGPLLPAAKHAGSFWPEDSSCLQWLDQQLPRSVVYAAFGSLAMLDQAQFQELALALELTNRPFLWVVREDMVQGSPISYPDGFETRVEHRGKIVRWAPQLKVLSHPSIACFLSHCGWNSTIEGVSNGMPFLCWPYFTDQFMHRSYICDLWGVGLGFNEDETGFITKEEIQGKVEQLLSNEQYTTRALELQAQAMAAIAEGGRSQKNLIEFVDWIMEN